MVVCPPCPQLIEKSKQKGEKGLMERREKVMMELEKLRTRVDEFNDYGELDMMQQYVQDIRTVQKRVTDVTNEISWINKVPKWSLAFTVLAFTDFLHNYY